MPDRARRQEILAQRMTEAGVDLMFLPISADLEYLTGLSRRVMTFGNVEYAHHFVAGAFFAPGRPPLMLLPRMIYEFDLPDGFEGDAVIVRELDDGAAAFEKAARSFGTTGKIALGPRTWAETVIHLLAAVPGTELVDAEPIVNPMRRIKDAEELETMTRACCIVDEVMGEITPAVVAGASELDIARDVDHLMKLKGSRTASFDTGVWSMGPGNSRDATVRISDSRIEPGVGVSFDFGSVIDGYCSDFGRTIFVGEPDSRYREVYDAVMAAQAAGMRAATPGTTAAEVDSATRRVIEDAGYGRWFRHRTGHCIGLDVHEHPFISEEDRTPLEVGMTFTIEPSVFSPGVVGVRVEDVIVCEEGGGRKLNTYPVTMAVND